MKHFIKSLFSLVLVINLLVVLIVTAKPSVNFESETIKSYTDIVSSDVYGVATINQTTITSYNKREIVEGKLADHKSYWLEPNVSLADSDLRVVNYTSGSATNWDGVKPTELAKIYESHTNSRIGARRLLLSRLYRNEGSRYRCNHHCYKCDHHCPPF